MFPPGYGNNTLSYNRISNVMRLLRDGGGIYVNGAENASWPSTMHDNYVTGDMAVFAVRCAFALRVCAAWQRNVAAQRGSAAKPRALKPTPILRFHPHPRSGLLPRQRRVSLARVRQRLRQLPFRVGLFHHGRCGFTSKEQPHGATLVLQSYGAATTQRLRAVELHRR